MIFSLRLSCGSQWSFSRFFVGCICSYTNYVGGWYFALNAFVCAVFAISIGMAAHAMGVDSKKLMCVMLLFGMVIGLFCLWGGVAAHCRTNGIPAMQVRVLLRND